MFFFPESLRLLLKLKSFKEAKERNLIFYRKVVQCLVLKDLLVWIRIMIEQNARIRVRIQ
jgi:hypothetical protein